MKKSKVILLSVLGLVLAGALTGFGVKEYRRVNPMFLVNFESVAEMRTYTGPSHRQRATTMGVTTIGDQYLRTYYYDTGSVLTDDGVNVIKLTAFTRGRYIKIPDIVNPTQIKKSEIVSASTSSTAGANLGLATFTFNNTYSVSPNVQPTFVTNNANDKILLESVSTTGCTVRVVRLTSLVGLLPTYTGQGGVMVECLVTTK